MFNTPSVRTGTRHRRVAPPTALGKMTANLFTYSVLTQHSSHQLLMMEAVSETSDISSALTWLAVAMKASSTVNIEVWVLIVHSVSI
jgi:hypothetical protein